MGKIQIPARVLRVALRIRKSQIQELTKGQTAYYEIEWDGPDVHFAFNVDHPRYNLNCSKPKGRQLRAASVERQPGLIYVERGYFKKQFYFDRGIYQTSMLHELYKEKDPAIEVPEKWVPSSKYIVKRPKYEPQKRRRCLLEQKLGDASLTFTQGLLEQKYQTAIEKLLERFGDEIVIKKHPKGHGRWWDSIAEKYNVPIEEFSTSSLNDFDQVLAWSSTAFIESIHTDMVQLGASSIGTFLKARSPQNWTDVENIKSPSIELIESRRKRIYWLFTKFCKKFPHYPRLDNDFTPRCRELLLQSIQDVLEWDRMTD